MKLQEVFEEKIPVCFICQYTVAHIAIDDFKEQIDGGNIELLTMENLENLRIKWSSNP